MITYKLTLFFSIFLILKGSEVNSEKVISVEQVKLASKESGIQFKEDGKNVLDIVVQRSSPPAQKGIFRRAQAAASDLKITRSAYSPCIRITDSTSVGGFCVDYKDYQWYGGPDRLNAKWPVQTHVIKKEPYIINFEAGSAFGEPYWLNSAGQSIYITSESPLVIDSNNQRKNSLCFLTNNTQIPYLNQPNVLEYEICFFNNAVNAHKHALEAYLKPPTAPPDESLYKYPTYNILNRYTRSNELNVRKYVDEILRKNFKIGALSISTGWETCYGSWTFDQNKFESINELTTYLHSLGIKVMVEGHPYIAEDCQPYFNEAKSSGRLVQSYHTGFLNTCWRGVSGGSIDFANGPTSTWFINKVKNFVRTAGIDFIDFGGGATNLLPKPWPYLNNNGSTIPDVYATKYLEAISAIQVPATVSVGRTTAYTRTITKLSPKDKRFDLNNGLQATIIQLLNANLHGYIFTKSDLIGGSGSGYDNKELYIRWLQASIFMPSLQFSKVPWDFDEETVRVAKKFLDIRERHLYLITLIINEAITKKQPVNAPIWWIAPDDETALKISDQYLFGEHMIVAPVLEAGNRSRDVYLPKGKWRECTDPSGSKIHDGPTWIHYPEVPLDQLPYFVNYNADYYHNRC